MPFLALQKLSCGNWFVLHEMSWVRRVGPHDAGPHICVADADVRNSHNRQKAAEYLMASEKCLLASSHTKKKKIKLPSNKLCTCCRMLISDVPGVGLHTNEFTLISGTKERKYALPLNSGGLLARLDEALVAIHKC